MSSQVNPSRPPYPFAAVLFDLDGVIVDSEHLWSEVREKYTRENGGTYTATATRDMMGMSPSEWSRYMAERLNVPGTPEEINAAIVERMLACVTAALSMPGVRTGSATIEGVPDRRMYSTTASSRSPIAAATSTRRRAVVISVNATGPATRPQDALSAVSA